MRKFYFSERNRHLKLIADSFFGNDNGNGYFKGKQYPFILRDGKNNLFEPIRDSAIQYFADNRISWWGGKKPSGHILSSQIACLNHLFSIRNNPKEVLDIINNVRNIFKIVLPLPCDKDNAFIAFEAVSKDDYLNEGDPHRGTNCTSVDALILAVDKNNDTWLIPIEWKYTESYYDYPSADKSIGAKGDVRLRRYSKLIDSSKQLKTLADYRGSIYYFEPFYQLMRQTLWAEQMIAHKDSEIINADHYLHIHVIPKNDVDLLDKKYRITKMNMENTWRSMITDQSKYVIIDPEDFMEPICASEPELWNYLSRRYYNK